MNYPRERKFRSYAGYSSNLMDVVKPLKTLAIRKHYNYERWSTSLDTVFAGVDVVPHHEAQRRFLNDLGGRTFVCEWDGACNLQAFSRGYMETLQDVIHRAWNPNKIHLVATSSGYDSRCITMAIKALAESLGSDWLGRVLFFEAAGEHEQFLKLMEMQGWSKDQYTVCYGGHASEYHDYSFDFSKAWRRLNGFISYPINVWYTPIEWMQEQGIIPSDDSQLQCFTMYGANETTRAVKHPEQTLEYYFWWHYYHMLSAFPLKGEWVHPSYDAEILAYLKSQRENLLNISDALSVCSVVAPIMFPEFRAIQKMSTKDVKLLGYLNPSRRIIEQAERDYRASWYGREVCPEIQTANDIEYREWWGRWATASMCEHLINQGRRVEIV